jgi:glycosyltransferase involved in cell wall biosynthesis
VILRGLKIVKSYRCTKLFAVFPSEEFLVAGHVIAEITGIPMYTYFHNTYVEQRRPGSVHYHIASRLQSRIFAKALHTFVMSPGMEELYRERYPHLRCSPLVHSFNEDVPEFEPPPPLRHPIRFVMCGNVNESCADAVVRVCHAVAHAGGTLSIVSGTPKRHLKNLGILTEGLEYKTVSRDVVLQCLREADIVILPHGFTGGLSDEEYRTIFPTKTIELLISRRPILAHTPADSYLTRFLRKHECALVVDVPQINAVVAGIERLRHDADLRSRLVRNALHASEAFRAPRVASTLRSILDGTHTSLVS